MKSWVEVDLVGNDGVLRQYRRGCNKRQLTQADRDAFGIIGVRHNTDGFTTLAVVTLKELNPPAGNEPFVVYGYGNSVRAIEDGFRAEIGVKNAIDRAFEGAATVMQHRLCARFEAKMNRAAKAFLTALK